MTQGDGELQPENQEGSARRALAILNSTARESLISVGVFSGAANLLLLTPAFFMLLVYDKAVAYNSVSTLLVLSAITLVLFVFLGAFEIIRSKLMIDIASRADQQYGSEVYRHTFLQAAQKPGTPANQSPLLDLRNLRQFLSSPAVFALFDVPWIPIYILVLFLFHPVFGWMGILSILSILSLNLYQQNRNTADLKAAQQVGATQQAVTAREFACAEAAVAMGMLQHLIDQWESRELAMKTSYTAAANTSAVTTGTTKVLRLAIQSAAIGIGALLVLFQEISPGMIIAGSIMVGRALQPIEVAVASWRAIAEANLCFQRLTQLLDSAPQAEEKMSLPAVTGTVVVTNAFLTAPGSSKVLVSNATVRFNPGTLTMIVGKSGAGKSSLIRGVLGLWPTSQGHIRIDGSDVSYCDRGELGPQIGYLPQAVELLGGSVAHNISRFQSYNSSDVIQAAVDAGVHEFILSLPEGYDTDLGTGMVMMSPGQSQRIALARALYQRPKLLVLDEPNSNLDDAGEEALDRALATMKASGATVILVSHRKGALSLVDQLVVMESGKVLKAGSVEAILRSDQPPQSIGVAKPNKELPTSLVVPVPGGHRDN
jgi:ATP-binding cassette subfamily C protein EexD